MRGCKLVDFYSIGIVSAKTVLVIFTAFCPRTMVIIEMSVA